MKKILILCLFISSFIYGHEQHVHQYLTKEAYYLLKDYLNNDIPVMLNHIDNGPVGPPWTNGTLLAGAWREDEEDIVYGLYQFMPGDPYGALTSITHFWDADAGNELATDMNGAFKPLLICYFSISVLPADYVTKEDSTIQTNSLEKKNLSFIELGGNGGLISFNYERYFSDNLSFRVGLGTVITRPILIPIMINYSYKNILEFGIGIVHYTNAPTGSWGGKIFAYKKSGSLITSVIGFKKRNKGFMYKVSITPFYNPVNSQFLFFGGLSFGYAF